MNTNRPIKEYVDERDRKREAKIQTHIKNKTVYKSNYELVMGHAAAIPTKTNQASKPSIPARLGGGTLNGASYRS